jgi:hypothetical protein
MFRSRRALPFLAFAVIATLAAACDGDSPTEPSGTLVGPAGGSFLFADGNVALFFPQGALSQDVYISVETAGRYPDSARVVDGTVYEFRPSIPTFLAA